MSESLDYRALANEFWKLIDMARSSTLRYRNTLKKMDRQQLIDYYWQYEETAGFLKSPPYTIRLKGMSNDQVDDIATWLVAQGEDAYTRVLRDPEQMPRTIPRPVKVLDDVVREYRRRFHDDIPFPDNA